MRSYGRIRVTIWRDADFVHLPAAVQRAYIMLVSQPDLTTCGVAPYVPRRWARFAPDTPIRQIEAAFHRLADERFLVIDEDAGEVLIRTFVKHEQIEANVKWRSAARSQFELIVSTQIRRALLAEYPALFDGLDVVPDALPETAQDALWDTPPDTHTDTPSDTHTSRTREEPRALSLEPRTPMSSEDARPRGVRPEVWDVFTHWRKYHPQALFTTSGRENRKAIIERALSWGYSPERCKRAIDGNHRDPHCNGENDRGRQYHDLGLILRNADQIEKYEANAATANGHVAGESRLDRARRVAATRPGSTA